jgi:lipoate-protein ligase B
MQREPARVCRLVELGLTPYRPAWELQQKLAEAIARGEEPETLILLEHPHIFTFGRRGRPEHLLWDEAACAARHVEVLWVDRGGDITYHGPGQLVGYPLLRLERSEASGRVPRVDTLSFLRSLEQVLIVALARLGLVAGQLPGLTGVWVQPDVASRCRRCPPAARQAPSKVAAIGVKVDAHAITRHGFALNVAPDMTYWDGIIACGLADRPAISLEQLLDPPPTMELVRRQVAAAFGEVFAVQIVPAIEVPQL